MRTITRASRKRKGVSSIIGMTIFLLIFAIGVAYIFIWTQNNGTYLDTVKHQVDFERSRLNENLLVTSYNSTYVGVRNPTAEVIVVTQIWSSNQMVWSGDQGVPPFSDFNFTTSPGDGNFKIVTFRGNVFSGSYQSQLEKATSRSWLVSWYWNNTSGQPPATPSQLLKNQMIGQSYWYDLNLDFEWTAFANPVIGSQYNMDTGVMLGFVAKTTMIKLSSPPYNATINFYKSNNKNCSVAISVDGALVLWNQTMNITGEQYSIHNVTVYFYNYGTMDAKIRLNVVNATFAP